MHVRSGPRLQSIAISADPSGALASRPESLNHSAMPELAFDRPPATAPLDRETLLARFDGIRPVSPRWPAGPTQALAAPLRPGSPEHDWQTEIRFNATEPAAAKLRAVGQRRARLLPPRPLGQRWPVAPARSCATRRRQGQHARGGRASARCAGRITPAAASVSTQCLRLCSASPLSFRSFSW